MKKIKIETYAEISQRVGDATVRSIIDDRNTVDFDADMVFSVSGELEEPSYIDTYDLFDLLDPLNQAISFSELKHLLFKNKGNETLKISSPYGDCVVSPEGVVSIYGQVYANTDGITIERVSSLESSPELSYTLTLLGS